MAITDGWVVDDPEWLAGADPDEIKDDPRPRKPKPHDPKPPRSERGLPPTGKWGNRYGEANSNATLTELQAIQLRARAIAGENQRKLAKEFGISQAQVSRIKRGRRWPHLTKPELLEAKRHG